MSMRQSKRTRHGLSHLPEYKIWKAIKTRVFNPNYAAHKHYGGRGIAMHPKWAASFPAFMEAVGPRPSPKHSIDRYPDNNGNYEPGNVRWATPTEQALNQRSNRLVEFGGQILPISEVARQTGHKPSVLGSRTRRMPLEVALTLKPRQRRDAIKLTFQGQTLTYLEWDQALGAKPGTVAQRIRKGWPMERALTEPILPAPGYRNIARRTQRAS